MNKNYYIFIFILIYHASFGYEFTHMTTYNDHKSSVSCIAFSNNSKYLASGSFDTTICIRDINSGKIINKLVHGAIIESITFTNDNKYVVSVGRDRCIKIWDVKSGNLIQIFGPLNDFLFCVAVSPDNKNILVGSYKYIYFLDIKKNIISYKFKTGNMWVRNIKFSPDNNFLGICGGNETIIYKINPNISFWHRLFGKTIDLKKISSYKSPSYVYSMDFSRDSQYCAFGNEHGEIYLYRIIDGFFLWSKKIFNSLIWSISFSPNNMIAVSGRDKDIVLLDLKSGTLTNILPTGSDENFSIAFSNNNKYLAISSKDGGVRIWKNNTNDFLILQKILIFIIIGIFIIIIIMSFKRKSNVKNWNL